MRYDGNTDKVIDMIKHAMVDTRTQQKHIVEKTGLNKGTISNFLNYKSSNPTLDTLKMYCDAMGCDLIIDIVPRAKEDVIRYSDQTDHAGNDGNVKNGKIADDDKLPWEE